MAIEIDGEIYEWISLAKGAAVEVEPTELTETDQVEEWLRLAKGDHHIDQAAELEDDDLAKRAFSDEHRDAAAKDGTAMSDGSYPIETPKDLENATADYKMGRVAEGQKAAVMAHIINRASDMGEPNPFEQEDESTEDSSDSSPTAKAAGESPEDEVIKESPEEETEVAADTRSVDLETFYYSKSEGDDPADADGGPDEVEKSADTEEPIEETTAPEGDSN